MSAVMTPKERLWAAMRHQEVDKVPCSPWLNQALPILYNDWKTDPVELTLRAVDDLDFDPHFNVGSGIPEYFEGTSGEQLAGWHPDVKVTLSARDDGPCDLVARRFQTPAGPLTELVRMPKPGRLEYGLDPNPFHREYLVKCRDDLERLRYIVPDPRAFPAAPDLQAMERRVGDKGVVQVWVRSPLDHQAGRVRALEDMMVDYYDDRAFFDAQLAIWYDKMMAESRAVLEHGARILFGSWYFASLSVGWSPKMYREIFLPMLKAHVALTHSYGAVYNFYDDGKSMGIIDMVAEAGADVMETLCPPPVGDLDLAEAKRRIGARVCLKGHGDMMYVLKMGKPETVDRMVRAAMEAAAAGSGFILGTSDSIRESTPRENIRTYFEAARTWGRELRNGP
jgi:hypothetical protein